MSLIYLASPYSHPDDAVREYRYDEAVAKVAQMAKDGEHVFSPIVHWHTPALMFDMPKDHHFWLELNHAMLDRCDQLHVLQIDGWEESSGIADEVEYAGRLGLPVIYTPSAYKGVFQ